MATTRNRKATPEPTLPLNMRIKPAVRNLIDRAAELVGKNRTEFMLEAPERRAEEVLLDRSVLPSAPKPTLRSWRGSMRRQCRTTG
jgi:uncharacterized protein (DUF1778 family)